jgi:hypothetical protein
MAGVVRFGDTPGIEELAVVIAGVEVPTRSLVPVQRRFAFGIGEAQPRQNCELVLFHVAAPDNSGHGSVRWWTQ